MSQQLLLATPQHVCGFAPESGQKNGARRGRSRSSLSLPAAPEAGPEALRELAGRGFAHRAGHAERPAERLLLGTQRAQPFVVAARNIGTERHAGVGREEVEPPRLTWVMEM